MSKVQTAPSTEVSSAPSAFGNALSGLLSRRSDACEHDVAVRKSLPTVDKELRAKRKERKLKKLLRLKEHAPVTDYEADGALERILIRTATKGVVTLFNAVTAQQKLMQDRKPAALATSKVAAADKVSKAKFFDMLKSGRTKSTAPADDADKQWSVLSDGYMMDAKAKDWRAADMSDDGQEIEQEYEVTVEDDEADEWE
ncbi:RRP15-like protein [Plasmodiophora brassicae]|uniref:RRP15-like protein n=1 Tax=Plasmodiophora brassicae TaxID=37360 RepID=A0A0G4J1T1_PLABS|nr:hypothetical protein PBRA_001837 [Plasmodiophora brassicae]SPR01272.1 unnamed protein product [Plasmodiophora brassicae]